MNKINYQKELDKVLNNLADERPGLLLHSCCAPCSSYVLEYLEKYFQITVFYYNPNIDSREEYEKRVAEQQRLIKEMGFKDISVIDGGYDPEVFYQTVKGYEKEPEGGARCYLCYRLRLEETARLAAQKKFDYFTTTLTISPLKNAQWLNELGQKAEEKYGIRFLPSDFKKKGGYQRSITLSKEYSLYRQNFCGCVFSKNVNEMHDL
ncbi:MULTISPECIES: epoxyqueuosine reductase QueH [Anaerostipes]|uniref:epoxyqueuosine reductase QueH n=1 Tax=Anaerostipes TaxID=207244 RepID=UPI001C1DD999|nr:MULTISPECIES: epoxyqueuosine reductase QueH [Anaerostipes]MCI5624263.1 epoxyqueuosine reductase QueH [Anaerostipes sp.]MDY2727348.1 epoxyqueuosine reductase QueH [Anaerostipes faecalis]